MKVCIVGGVAGGAATAARLRRNDERAEIVMFERGEHISYANCGLPYYIGGVIPDRKALFLQTPQGFSGTFRVDVRVGSEVLAVDRSAKTILVRETASGREYRECYDKLLLSPGAEPVRPPLPGIDLGGIFTLRSVSDTDRIAAFIDQVKARRALIVGAGFIGLEMAENLRHRGMEVVVVELADQVLNVLDPELASEVRRHAESKGVRFRIKEAVVSLEQVGGGIVARLSGGASIETDLVILSIGVRPDAKLAKAAGLEIGATGGIRVNAFMQTSDPDVYAVGDATEFPNPVTGKPATVFLAGPAAKQARIAADNIAFGNASRYPGSFGTAAAKVFDLTAACTGLSEKALIAQGVSCRAVHTHSSSHAGYYPGAQGISLKVLFDPESGKLLGAQAVGGEGVDKRIDLIATVLKFGGTVRDLAGIEHAYAPPYSSAKDPVNIVGFIGDNILAGRSRHVSWREVREKRASFTLLDVRTPGEFEAGTIEGAVNIPVQVLRQRLGEIPKGKPLIVFCGVGFRAYLAERILRQNGFEDAANLSGGWKTWSAAMRYE